MGTAETVLAFATVFGAGALLRSGWDHLLSRKDREAVRQEKRVDLAEKSIRVADGMMTRMEADLNRLQTALERAQQEGEDLRQSRGRATDDRLNHAYLELAAARQQVTALQKQLSRAIHPSRQRAAPRQED